jgi:hypothetical protein
MVDDDQARRDPEQRFPSVSLQLLATIVRVDVDTSPRFVGVTIFTLKAKAP